jgi:hypothetical protein
MARDLRVGLYDHFGWAIAVTTSPAHEIVDRRRIELLEPGMGSAPIHHEGKALDDAGAAALVAEVRASIARATAAAFDELPTGITTVCLRAIPADFPTDISVLRQVPWEARADAVMYREEIAAVARARGWAVALYDAKRVEAQAAERLGKQAGELLHDVRERLGAPWTKDHRLALAATIVSR